VIISRGCVGFFTLTDDSTIRCPVNKFFAVGLIAAVFTTSCAFYTPQSVPKPRVKSMAVSRWVDWVSVGVNPYVNSKKSTETFGADLKEAGILALQVIVANQGQRRLAVRKSDFLLRLPVNREYIPAPITSVASRLESSAGVNGWGIGFGLIGLLDVFSQQEKADSARRADLRNKEFRDTTLAPQEEVHGFLFFLIPADVQQLKNAALVVRVIDVADATVIKQTKVPLEIPGVWNVNGTE